MDSTSSQPQSADLGIGDLAAARLIRAATIAARTAGSIDGPLPVLSEAELNAPIGDDDTKPWQGKGLFIRGYKVGNEIGSGGQAIVYRGIQEATGREVAIKVIPGGPFVSSRRRARFEREAKLLAGFDHPNIIGILDRGRTDDGSFFIVMDLVEGVSLDQYWIELNNEPEKLARLFTKIACAVDEAHQRGIVHRDIKPSNIRVDRRGEPHILDFGLARMTDADLDEPSQNSITHSGQLVGSLPWSSPEQTKNDEDGVDSRSDVYSLGVMMYQSIAGRFPYKIDGSLRDILNRIATSIPLPPSKTRPQSKGGFRALDGITLKALAKNPDDRYSSARGFADDLDNYLAGRPMKAMSRRHFIQLASIKYAVALAVLCIMIVGWALGSAKNFNAPVIAELPRFMGPAGITFVRLPMGSASMGSKAIEAGHGPDETFHKVTFDKSFWISTTEVTQGQFIYVMGFNPSDPKYLGNSLPVQRVTWDEAQEFCRRLGVRAHRKCQLPTEAEWEYACRATELSPFGNGVNLDGAGWWIGNSDKHLHAVATKQPNFWGLYDMHGGVAEWCLDPYQTYTSSTGENASTSEAHPDRVIRGGSFLSAKADCRAAARAKAPPDTRSSEIGFRVVYED